MPRRGISLYQQPAEAKAKGVALSDTLSQAHFHNKALVSNCN